MHGLLPSGRFAQLARLSRKALRLYAEQGLLRPVHTHIDSGYHYYSPQQLEEAHRIARLRELGMPLARIQDALRVWNTPALESVLLEHRAHLLAQAEQVKAALHDLDALVHAPRPAYPVTTRILPALRYLAVQFWCDPEQACERIGQEQRRLHRLLEAPSGVQAGACFAHYPSETEEAWEIEVGLPFQGDPGLLEGWSETLPEGIALRTLPSSVLAYTVHAGDCGGNQGLHAAYEAVWSWVREHGHQTRGGPLEFYPFDDTNTPNPLDHRTEIAWRLETEGEGNTPQDGLITD